jgi:hypothetical protein
MRDENHNLGGLRELRLRDARLSRLPDPDSRFRAAAHLVAFFAQRTGAQVISWCVEGEEVIILAEGGAAEEEGLTLPAPRARRSELLAEAAGELLRSIQYRRDAERAKDPYASLGYLDMAREAQNAAAMLAKKAEGLD